MYLNVLLLLFFIVTKVVAAVVIIVVSCCHFYMNCGERVKRTEWPKFGNS